jgi:hypothetical protein
MTDVTANILRNRGVPVKVAQVTFVDKVLPNGTAGRVPTRRTVEIDGEEHTAEETAWIRFTNNTFADMEERWGSLAQYAEIAKEQPKTSLRQLLAIVWDVDLRQAGEMMLPGLDDDYTAAIGAAMSVANGVDPTIALRMLDTTGVASGRLAELRNDTVTDLLDQADVELRKLDSPGSDGSEPGSASDSPPKRSGRARQPKSRT